MKVYGFILVFSGVARAAAVGTPSDDTDELNVVLQQSKASLGVSIAAWNTGRTELLAHSCSSSLNTGSFKTYDISFAVDAAGSGNITVGGTEYVIHSVPEFSGGISCTKLYTSEESLVSCIVPVPRTLGLAPLDPATIKECFGGEQLRLGQIHTGLLSAGFTKSEQYPSVARKNVPEAGVNNKRQTTCGIWTSSSRMVGDGDPHQNPMNIMLSSPLNCGQGSCEVGREESQSQAVEFSATIPITEWLDGGFAVQESVQTGADYSCEGEAGETVCVWKNQGQTAYTVQNGAYNACTGFSASSEPFVLWSPNKDELDSSYYCVHGAQFCPHQGARWLDKNGRAGGP